MKEDFKYEDPLNLKTRAQILKQKLLEYYDNVNLK